MNFEEMGEWINDPDFLRDKKNGEVFNLAEFGNRRKKGTGSLRWTGNVISINGINLDIDKVSESGLDEQDIRKVLKGFCFIAHTTWSSTPENPRYRVIILFLRPVPATFQSPVFDYFNEKFDGCLDPSGKNVSHIYIGPVYKPGKRGEYQCFIGEGEFFDPEKAGIEPTVEPTSKKKGAGRKASQEKPLTPDFELSKIDVDALPLNEHTRNVILTGDASDHGGDRSAAYFSVICKLVDIGRPLEDIVSILLDERYGISERHRGKGFDWTVQEVQRAQDKVGRSEYRLRRGVPPHYPQTDALPVAEAEDRLREKTRQAFSEGAGYKGLRAPAGIGKTHVCLEETVDWAAGGRLIEYYVPTHRLGEEVKDRLLELDPNLEVEVIRGRDYRSKHNPPLCQKTDLAKAVAAKGLPVYSTLCRSSAGECQHFSNCRYLAQFKDSTRVRIYTHAHLALARGPSDRELPDFVVIDESFWPTLVDTQYTTVEKIRRFVQPKALAVTLINALEAGKPVLAWLHKRFGDELLATLDEALSRFTHKSPNIVPGMDGSDVIDMLNGYRPPKALEILLTNLRFELKQFPKRQESRVVRYRAGKVAVANKKPITRFTKPVGNGQNAPSQVPVLCIDADFEQEIAKVFLPGIRPYHLAVERNATVTQVSSTRNAKMRYLVRHGAKPREKSLARMHLSQTQDIIDRRAARGSVLVVGPQAIVGNPKKHIPPKIKRPETCEFAHFGALRGIDMYKEVEAVVVISRNQPRLEDIEDIAASLWWDSALSLDLPGEFTEEVRGYRLREGGIGVLTAVHPDGRVQLVLEQIRERETLQAIDRLRLIHNKTPKEVWVLSNLPLDITVDRLVSWRHLANDGTPMEKAFREYIKLGVMPLSPQLLFERHPELFPSENAAKKAVSRLKGTASKKYTKSDEVYLEILNKKCHLLKYCVSNARGPHKTALVPGNFDADKVKSALEELHGTSVTLIDADKVKSRLEEELHGDSVKLIDADKVLPKEKRKVPHKSSASGHRASPSASRRSKGTRRRPILRLRKRKP